MTPTLYCLMREDLQDLNPGKAMAQAMHAQADFDQWVSGLKLDDPRHSYINQWKEDRSFGRTLVLAATIEQIGNLMTLHTDAYDRFAGATIDPTYPWRNFYGKLFTSEEVTCAWFFACDITPPNQIDFVKTLSLHQ